MFEHEGFSGFNHSKFGNNHYDYRIVDSGLIIALSWGYYWRIDHEWINHSCFVMDLALARRVRVGD